MSSQKKEIERLQRLRARQLAARDPKAKDEAFYGAVGERHKRASKVTLVSALKELEKKWVWMLAGGILGTIAALIFAALIQAEWVPLVGFAIICTGLVVGRLLGAVMDWRNDDWQRK